MKALLKKLAPCCLKSLYRKILKIYKAKFLKFGRCNLCGNYTAYLGLNAFTLTTKKERNDLACIRCGAIARNRALVQVLLDLYASKSANLRALSRNIKFRNLQIYSNSCRGPIHDCLNGLPNYVASEYISDVPLGTFREGIRCEDLQNLSFSDESFNLMISEDVLEHVRNVDSALREVYRVLKPDGLFVFTVPIYGEQTVVRVDTSTDEDIHLLPPVYHGDPLRQEGALAYNDFGRDIVDRCKANGLRTHLVEFEAADRRFIVGDVILTKKVAV